MLRHAEFGKFKEGIDVESLPATFKDAISATARLGLRYLWIDALCIIQDSREDWMREAATMSKVYSYTFLTLAAAASENSAGGLYRSRSPCAVNGVKLKITWPGYAEGEFYCVPDDPWLKAVHRSPLLERAWVFQERLLSSRTVYFAFDQLYWECGELYASELYPYGGPWDLEFRQKQFDVAPRLPNGIQPAEDGRFKHAYTAMFLRTPSADWTSPEEFPYIWVSIVTQYSIGRLTYEKDKLMAISGVANRMAMLVGGDEYVAGLWRSSLPLLLLWHSRQRRSRPTSYQAPTWSWASLLGPVNMDFMFRAQNPPDIAIDVLKVSTTHPPGSAATGPVIDASLSVRGPLCEATATKSLRRNLTGPLSSPFYTKSLGKYEKCTMQPFRIESTLILHKKGLQTSYPSTVFFDRDPSKYSRIFCLKIATSDVRHPWGIVSMDCGLILAPTAVRGQFIRIGYFEIAPAKMRRPWRANRGLQRRDHRELEASLFKGSCVKSRFYEEFDGGDRYTITII
ncbi:Heterokaryon incompatibility [Macrophomina phaseolina MS6]|uniref:Heterokaryon incompatibility n=1 Tax=Macrophomina phaseolina (strain MS6) TaxID=1126212 RepID=K2S3X5_MACPH|nr:Heterokaryon incompatibility [Macrophomina phaseolina MS6]